MVFTHGDLDGAISALVVKWTFKKANVDIMPVTTANFRNKFTQWLSNNDIADYDTIFITDLGIYEDKELIDYPNVFIIDHHEGHDSSTYKNAKCAIKNYTSACLLAYKIFKKLYNVKLSKAQLHLILLGDDFDSYKFDLKDSYNLNIVYWDTTKKFETFIKEFSSGFHGFNMNQENIIKIHNDSLNKLKKELEVYSGTLNIQGEDRYICSTFASKYINEVADHLLADYNAEIALVVNTKTDHISYRRKQDSDVNLAELAKKLSDGGGHEYSSGSKITEKFILFTKQLTKIKT